MIIILRNVNSVLLIFYPNFQSHFYDLFVCLFAYYFIVSDPGDQLPLLLSAGVNSVFLTHLNGSLVSNLTHPPSGEIQTLDFVHAAAAMCWISSGQLWCAEMTKLKNGVTEKRRIRISHNLQSEYGVDRTPCRVCEGLGRFI